MQNIYFMVYRHKKKTLENKSFGPFDSEIVKKDQKTLI